jgi:Cu(I)/Ag(I) efflux system membrane protein CusA/SilA
VGFLALFGIATDDGVLVATFLKDSFKKSKPDTIHGIRDAVVEGGLRRVRPAMMTTATTILALLPVLTSTGRGADIMVPMAIPSFGGMTLQMITMFTVPVLYSLWQEWGLRLNNRFSDKNKAMKILTIALMITAFAASTAKAQSLNELIKESVVNNLELKVLENEYLAALEKAPQVSELPDPEVGIGAFPLPVETRLGPQITRLSASQMFPWFGTLESKAALENAKAKALYERIAAQQLNIIYAIKTDYYRLYEIEQSQSIIQRNMTILESLERLALAKVESGKATAADVLRVQLKKEELMNELEILETAKISPTASINQLLNRSLDTPITISDNFSFAHILYDKDSLIVNIRDNHPMLRMFELQQEVSRKAISLNELNGKPILGVGIDYIMVNQRNDAEVENNGRDIMQFRASVKIPIYRKKYAALELEENLKIKAFEYEKADLLSRFAATIEKALAAHQTARLKAALYERQIEITQAAVNILETDYTTSGNNFDELLRLEKELIDYDLKILKTIVESHIAKSSIERFIIQ